MTEIIVGDELIEIEEGDEALLRYVHKAKEAQDQIKAWERHAAIAKAAIEALQEEKKASYDTDFGTLVVSKRAPTMARKVDKDGLLNEELTRVDLDMLLRAAGDISLKEVEKLKDSPLVGLVKQHIRKEPRKGFIVIETGTKYAP